MRSVTVSRRTQETEIELRLSIDGNGLFDLDCGSAFMAHMLKQIAVHGEIDISGRVSGDTHVDQHHTVEDLGLVLGEAIDLCLGSRTGLARYGQSITPMDDALMLVALDFSGRPYLGWDVDLPVTRLGDFETELVREFMQAFANRARAGLHIRQLAGHNTHHIVESAFKGLGRALRQAVAITSGSVPSSKGSL
jgi:imidazoleglycerol-phosphate dehydratase